MENRASKEEREKGEIKEANPLPSTTLKKEFSIVQGFDRQNGEGGILIMCCSNKQSKREGG
jgi:hypothetical protein